MKPRYFPIAALVVAIPVVLLMLNLVTHDAIGAGQKAMSTSRIENGQAENTGELAETDARPTAVAEPSESPVAAEQSGTALLQTHCAQCHSVKLLEQTRKSRTDWEKTLSRMQKYGDSLSDGEKFLVLEHLSAPDKR